MTGLPFPTVRGASPLLGGAEGSSPVTDGAPEGTVGLPDRFGRVARDLRVSVTDRCDFRCVYCMSENMSFLPKQDLLTLEELDRLCSAFIARGVRKLRLTGGEPLVRRGIMGLFEQLARHRASGALEELTLTTNGTRLAEFADRLSAAGVRRINVSIDTLDAERYRRLTRGGDLSRALAGIAAADAAGMAVKINVVALAGENEAELADIAAFLEQVVAATRAARAEIGGA